MQLLQHPTRSTTADVPGELLNVLFADLHALKATGELDGPLLLNMTSPPDFPEEELHPKFIEVVEAFLHSLVHSAAQLKPDFGNCGSCWLKLLAGIRKIPQTLAGSYKTLMDGLAS